MLEFFLTVLIVSSIGIIKYFFEERAATKAKNELRMAEENAFLKFPEEWDKVIKEYLSSEGSPKGTALANGEKEKAANALIEESHSAISMGRLFNLYSKQIETYQQQTRARATWSFTFALIAMFAGLGFVFWGGTFILSEAGRDHLAAGASISAIGGGISAYITKTFLDVHRLSLMQLNHYFKQPVINDHILMAQRLADELDDDNARQKGYETVINSISKLIDGQNQTENEMNLMSAKKSKGNGNPSA